MKLKVGDVVEFKKYEDMTEVEAMRISDEIFPKYGKITEIGNDSFFFIKDYGYLFNPKSVARVISDVNDDDDVDDFKPGEEVWVKATVNVCYDDTVFINPVERFFNKDSLKKVKHETQERFIVKEDYYGMYIGVAGELVGSKDTAQAFTSRNDANEEATNMHLNAWEVIPYDN